MTSTRMNSAQQLAQDISQQLLELVDDASKMTRSDLQGCAEALAMQAVEKARRLNDAA